MEAKEELVMCPILLETPSLSPLPPANSVGISWIKDEMLSE